MKIIRMFILLFFVSISSSFAQADMSDIQIDANYEVSMAEVTPTVAPIKAEPVVYGESDKKSKLFSLLINFISSGVMAFILCLFFPKFFKKTGAVLLETKKLSILFEALKVMFISIAVIVVGFFLLVGLYPAVVMLATLIILFLIGIPVFSIGVLEGLFAKRKIKFEKLTKTNKLISLMAVNLIIMVIILPITLFAPIKEIVSSEAIVKVNVYSNGIRFILSLIGIGMFYTHLRAVLSKNSKKL